MRKKITIYDKKSKDIYGIIFIEGYEQDILSKNIAMDIERIKIKEVREK